MMTSFPVTPPLEVSEMTLLINWQKKTSKQNITKAQKRPDHVTEQDWEGSYEPTGHRIHFLWMTAQTSPLHAVLTQGKWESSEEGWERWKPGSSPP